MHCRGSVLLRHQTCSNRSISPASWAHSSKPAACCCSGRTGQTDGRTTYHYIDPAPHSTRAVPIRTTFFTHTDTHSNTCRHTHTHTQRHTTTLTDISQCVCMKYPHASKFRYSSETHNTRCFLPDANDPREMQPTAAERRHTISMCDCACRAQTENDRATIKGGSVAEWLACWTQAQKGLGSNRSRDDVG